MLRLGFLLIVMSVLLGSVVQLSHLADALLTRFADDLLSISCAREEVFQRNINDAYRHLASRYAYVKDRLFEPEAFWVGGWTGGGEDREGCTGRKKLPWIFRESNPQLPSVYPNWVYKEAVYEKDNSMSRHRSQPRESDRRDGGETETE